MDKDSSYNRESIINNVELYEGQQARLKRIHTHSYSKYPYSCIGVIIGNYLGSSLSGTGSLLSSHTVLTSANVIIGIDRLSMNKLRKIMPEHLVFYTQICG